MMKYSLLILMTTFLFSSSFLSAQENLALGKKAWESTTYGSSPSKAVDGNRDGNYFNNSVTHTKEETGAIWTVDLGAVYDITKINIFNRTDCCAERLDNFTILVTEDGNWNTATKFAENVAYEPGRVRKFNGTTKGRWVRVKLNGTGYLSLAEVEVYGLREKEGASIKIGDEIQGGIVFYVDETGQHGKVAAPADQASSATWYEAYELCINLTEYKYTNWYFPTKEEMEMMYNNLHQAGLGNFDGWYWNSSELDGNDEVGGNMNFSGGDQGYDSKDNELKVRAARAF